MSTLFNKIASSSIVGGRQGLLGLIVLAALIFIILPLGVDLFRLNLIGKYLTMPLWR
jgi:urea transport system permease protein